MEYTSFINQSYQIFDKFTEFWGLFTTQVEQNSESTYENGNHSCFALELIKASNKFEFVSSVSNGSQDQESDLRAEIWRFSCVVSYKLRGFVFLILFYDCPSSTLHLLRGTDKNSACVCVLFAGRMLILSLAAKSERFAGSDLFQNKRFGFLFVF